jgi:hypothetical protein
MALLQHSRQYGALGSVQFSFDKVLEVLPRNLWVDSPV